MALAFSTEIYRLTNFSVLEFAALLLLITLLILSKTKLLANILKLFLATFFQVLKLSFTLLLQIFNFLHTPVFQLFCLSRTCFKLLSNFRSAQFLRKLHRLSNQPIDRLINWLAHRLNNSLNLVADAA